MIFNMTDTSGGGGGVTVEALSVNTNGTYTAPTGKAYSPVTVNVSGGGTVEAKDVNFYDYDGTILHAYTAAEFIALGAMPSNPDHSGDTIPLTSQGWNWSYADAKTYVQSYGMLEIGQMYKPTDGKTHLVIEIPAKTPSAQLTYYVRYTQSVTQGVTVDWGDGNSETFTGTSAANRSHTYAAPGTYDITLNVTSGNVQFVGSSSNSIYGSSNVSNAFNRGRLKRIHIGSSVPNLGGYALSNCYSPEILTIPKDISTNVGDYAFQNCYTLKACILPSTTSGIGYGASVFSGCQTATVLSFPKNVTSIGVNGCRYMYSLKRVTLPNGGTTVGGNMFDAAYSLQKAVVPSGISTSSGVYFASGKNLSTLVCYEPNTPVCTNATVLTDVTLSGTVTVSGAFTGCYRLASLTIPATVTSIAASAFQNCYGMVYIHMLPTSPPSLANANAFTNNTATIVVPDASVAGYKAASNWSDFSSRIIGETDFGF